MNASKIRLAILSIITLGGIAAAATFITISQTHKAPPPPEKPHVTIPIPPESGGDGSTTTPGIPPSVSPSDKPTITNEQAQLIALGYLNTLNKTPQPNTTLSNPRGVIEDNSLCISYDVDKVESDGTHNKSTNVIKYSKASSSDNIQVSTTIGANPPVSSTITVQEFTKSLQE